MLFFFLYVWITPFWVFEDFLVLHFGDWALQAQFYIFFCRFSRSEKLKYRAGNRVLKLRKSHKWADIPAVYVGIQLENVIYSFKNTEKQVKCEKYKFRIKYRTGSSRISGIHGLYIRYALSVYHGKIRMKGAQDLKWFPAGPKMKKKWAKASFKLLHELWKSWA